MSRFACAVYAISVCSVTDVTSAARRSDADAGARCATARATLYAMRAFHAPAALFMLFIRRDTFAADATASPAMLMLTRHGGHAAATRYDA